MQFAVQVSVVSLEILSINTLPALGTLEPYGRGTSGVVVTYQRFGPIRQFLQHRHTTQTELIVLSTPDLTVLLPVVPPDVGCVVFL